MRTVRLAFVLGAACLVAGGCSGGKGRAGADADAAAPDAFFFGDVFPNAEAGAADAPAGDGASADMARPDAPPAGRPDGRAASVDAGTLLDGPAREAAPHVDGPVQLNEVQEGTAAADENVELVNTSTRMISLAGYQVCVWTGPSAGTVCYTFPAKGKIGASGFVVVHWAQTGADTMTDYYAVEAATGLDDLTLLDATGAIADYLHIGAGPGAGSPALSAAVAAGEWPSTTATVSTSGFAAGDSYARHVASGVPVDTESPSDWSLDGTPTLGAANNCGPTSCP